MQSTMSSIKHHKLKRRIELNERKALEILKNYFEQFYKLFKPGYNFTSIQVHGNIVVFKFMEILLYSCRDTMQFILHFC